MYEGLINAITEARNNIRANIRQPIVNAEINNRVAITEAGWDTVLHLLYALKCDAEEIAVIAQYKSKGGTYGNGSSGKS